MRCCTLDNVSNRGRIARRGRFRPTGSRPGWLAQPAARTPALTAGRVGRPFLMSEQPRCETFWCCSRRPTETVETAYPCPQRDPPILHRLSNKSNHCLGSVPTDGHLQWRCQTRSKLYGVRRWANVAAGAGWTDIADCAASPSIRHLRPHPRLPARTGLQEDGEAARKGSSREVWPAESQRQRQRRAFEHYQEVRLVPAASS